MINIINNQYVTSDETVTRQFHNSNEKVTTTMTDGKVIALRDIRSFNVGR